MSNPELTTSLNSLSPDLPSLDLELFMRAALAEAEMAGRAGVLPIGAVVVIDSSIKSKLISAGYKRI